MNKEFLLELYSGEIPALCQEGAALQLQDFFKKKLVELGLAEFSTSYYFSSRRIALLIENLESEVPEKAVQVRGPKLSANSSAIEAFAKSCGVAVSQLERLPYKDDVHYFCNKLFAAQKIEQILVKIASEALSNFYWPKSMKWDESGIRWIRPLLNILALYNHQVVPIKFGKLEANNLTFGHFFEGKKQLAVADFKQYSSQLLSSRVLYDQNQRRALILKEAEKLANENKLTVIGDERLLEELMGLAESPNLILGSIDHKFLSLPREVLQCTIKSHQRYICLQDQEGEFADKFIVVANSLPRNNDLVIKGNERVLNARLNDAIFYYREDQKRSLLERKNDLAKITFHKHLGTIANKTARVGVVAVYLAQVFGYPDLAKLEMTKEIMKSDLTTELVGELPELQGKIGYYYALDQKHDREIAEAIKEHYQPQGKGDYCPQQMLSVIMALADKIDSMVGLWAAGEKPTGSKDAFGVRRLALGIIRILLENKLHLDLAAVVELASEQLKAQQVAYDFSCLLSEIEKFILERFQNFIKEEYDYLLLKAVSDAWDPYRAKLKLDAIKAHYANPGNQVRFNALKRLARFVSSPTQDKIDCHLFNHELEHKLYQALNGEAVNDLESLLGMGDLINEYFDQIIINDENDAIKNNRHNLIALCQQVVRTYADFSQL